MNTGTDTTAGISEWNEIVPVLKRMSELDIATPTWSQLEW